ERPVGRFFLAFTHPIDRGRGTQNDPSTKIMKHPLTFPYILLLFILMLSAASTDAASTDEVVKLGLNYPKSGPYEAQGADQLRAAQLAVEEVNAAGGILGKRVELVLRDSQSSVPVSRVNVLEMILKEKVAMVFGGAASSVAV